MYLTGTESEPLVGANGILSCPSSKVLICHYPPGNPANMHSICVGPPAWPPHHRLHNDTMGACGPGGGGGGGGDAGSGGGGGGGGSDAGCIGENGCVGGGGGGTDAGSGSGGGGGGGGGGMDAGSGSGGGGGGGGGSADGGACAMVGAACSSAMPCCNNLTCTNGACEPTVQ